MKTQLQGKTITILGLGLIGGSIARGLRKRIPGIRVLAWDRDEEPVGAALREHIIDESGDRAALCREADVVVLAMPSLAIVEILPQVLEESGSHTVVTDVGSVKTAIYKAVELQDVARLGRYVPGHPIAGSEKSGFAAADAMLFEDRNVILTPHPHNECNAVAIVNEMWRVLGANVLGMELQWHDEVLAATSHLPHLLAYAIVDVLARQESSEDIFRYAAGGFADFSRLASSDPQMWSDIFLANADATVAMLEQYVTRLGELRRQIESKDGTGLYEAFANARAVRQQFIVRHYSDKDSQVSAAPHDLVFETRPQSKFAQDMPEFRVPGDKSISHRAVILGAIANGVSRITGFLEGEDALNTVAAFREMGVTITGPRNGNMTIYGVGKDGLKAPRRPLYMGNSGTAMRLLAGILAAQDFSSTLSGDESLSRRPMSRIAVPLKEMGARLDTTAQGTPPLQIHGTALQGISYELPMASAQVKSCLLLAGLYAEGVTEVVEPEICRDHTERMLAGFGVALEVEQGRCRLRGGQQLQPGDIDVPGDISSAAFFLVAAAITPGASLQINHVGVNPTRVGIINLLQAMGADISLTNRRTVGGEPVADIVVKQQPLSGIEIPAAQIPLAIDEFPALFIAAACAAGETTLHGAEELRVKESDRIDAMAVGLSSLGIETETYPDGIRICGGALAGGEIDSRGDHRIAMAFAIAGIRASGNIRIHNCANVNTSFPGFVELAASLGLNIRTTC
ncbi:MAG: bifunctional prephenate dehydrogenase/3-phosphoshikimate 1-carboxyvinyltransferase [Gammaproteobacteria bacterium]